MKYPILIPLSKMAVATTDEIEFQEWPPDALVCVQLVAFEDDTTQATEVRVGFRRNVDYCWLESFPTPAAGLRHNYHWPVWLVGDFPVVVQWVDCAVGDRLEALLCGYWEQRPPR